MSRRHGHDGVRGRDCGSRDVGSRHRDDGRSISDAVDMAKTVLDILRAKAASEKDPLRKAVMLRSLHVLTCGEYRDDCDSGDELDLEIAQLSQGAAERITRKRMKRLRMTRLLAAYSAKSDNEAEAVEGASASALTYDNDNDSGIALDGSATSSSDDDPNDELQDEDESNVPQERAESDEESDVSEMEEAFAMLDLAMGYKLWLYEFSSEEMEGRKKRDRALVEPRALARTATSAIPLLSVGTDQDLSDPRIVISE